MAKSTRTYWNPLAAEQRGEWTPIEGLEGIAEEVFIVDGSLYDPAFDRWLTKGDYASRPPGEAHGPFRTEEGCLVLEISFPSQSIPE